MTDEELLTRIKNFKDNKDAREAEIKNHFVDVCDKLLARKDDVAAMSKLIRPAEEAGISFFSQFCTLDISLYCYTLGSDFTRNYGVKFGNVLLTEFGLFTIYSYPTADNQNNAPEPLTARDVHTASKYTSNAEALLAGLDGVFKEVRDRIVEATK